MSDPARTRKTDPTTSPPVPGSRGISRQFAYTSPRTAPRVENGPKPRDRRRLRSGPNRYGTAPDSHPVGVVGERQLELPVTHSGRGDERIECVGVDRLVEGWQGARSLGVGSVVGHDRSLRRLGDGREDCSTRRFVGGTLVLERSFAFFSILSCQWALTGGVGSSHHWSVSRRGQSHLPLTM